MDINYFNSIVLWMILFMFVIWNTQNVLGATTTRTINVIVSRMGSLNTFGQLLEESSPFPGNIQTDPSQESQTVWEIGENNAGSDYKSSTNLTTLNILESRVLIFNHYGMEMLRLDQCNLTSTPKTCKLTGTPLYFKYIKGTNDLILVPDQNSLDNTRVASIVFSHYYSFPEKKNMILIGEGNLATSVSQGCRNGGTFVTTASETPLTIDRCASACQNSSYIVLAVGSGECYCTNDTEIGTETEATGCTANCPGNADQKCGSSSSKNVFLLNEYNAFSDQWKHSLFGSEVKVVINMTSNSTPEEFCFGQPTTVLSFTIVEEEECYLTNLYFNTTSPGYYIYYGSGILDLNKKLKTQADEYEFYPNDENKIDIGSIDTDCIWISPIAHNYTYHRAIITIYGKEATDYVAHKYMALQLDVLDEESSTIMPSSTMMESSSSLFDSFITVTAASTLCMSDLSSEIESTSVMEDVSSSMEESSSLEETSSPVEETSSPMEESSSPIEESSSIMPSEAESSSMEATTMESSSLPESTMVESSSDVSPSSPVSSEVYGPSTSYEDSSTSLYPTPTESASPEATINPSEPVTSSACSCLCRKNDGKNITDEDIAQQRVEEIKEKLKVDTEKLSATIRKKISAEDNRPSAQGVGFVGVFFLTLVFSSLVLLDVTSICQHISMMKENVIKRKP